MTKEATVTGKRWSDKKHACIKAVCGGWVSSKGRNAAAAHRQQLRRADHQLRGAASSQAHLLLARHLCRPHVLQSTKEGFHEVPGLPTCTPTLGAM